MRWLQRMANAGENGEKREPAALREKPKERGVALVITLLLLFLFSVLGLAAVLSSGSDMLINGYYSNYRGSFYAADSGLNIVRQAMYNQLNSTFTTAFPTFSTPPPSTVTSVQTTVLTYIQQNFEPGLETSGCVVNPSQYAGSSQCYLNSGTSQKSWSESFTIPQGSFQFSLATGFTNPNPTYTGCSTPCNITGYNYVYNYTIESVGSATGSEQNTVTETGSILITVNGLPSSYNASFAIFGAFITNYSACLGPLVPGTMTGQMFTDGEWGFEPGGSYIFTDPVGQANANASWFDSYWDCYQGTGPSYTAPDGQTIAPTFESGFTTGDPAIAQPGNSFSQSWAAVDGLGEGEDGAGAGNAPATAPTAAQLNEYMQDVTGTAYPSGGATSGVYFNVQTVNGTPTMSGGGLYIEGNADSIVLTPFGSSGETYTITQNGVVTTMTVDPVANTTTVTSGTHTQVLSGVPLDTSVQPSMDGTMIYVDGTINSMSGPGEGLGAINNTQAVTVSALGDINITGDVRYVTEPVTTSPNQIAGAPVSTLIPGSNSGQDLGIFTANGSIILSSNYGDDNLEVDGSQAVIGSNCASWSCGFYVNGCINTFNNVGGQIQTNIFGACLGTENTYYDRRYTSVPGFAPPWFPSTTITSSPGSGTTPPLLTLQRLSWVSSSGQ